MAHKLTVSIAAILMMTASDFVSADDWTPYEPPTPYWDSTKPAYAREPIEIYTLDRGYQGMYEPNDSGGYDYWSVDQGYEATTVRGGPGR